MNYVMNTEKVQTDKGLADLTKDLEVKALIKKIK